MDGRRVDEATAKHLGGNLRRARRRAGYSQEQLAKLSSLHRTEIGLLENGRRLPRVDTLMRLAGSLEVGAEELLRGMEWTPRASRAPACVGDREG